jgi:hypothetical protein
MPYRGKKPEPPKPSQPTAVEVMMQPEFQDRPFGGRGGIVGEFVSGSGQPTPPPQLLPPLIPPPPWSPNYVPELDPAVTVDEEDEQ